MNDHTEKAESILNALSIGAEIHPRLRAYLRLVRDSLKAGADDLIERRAAGRLIERLGDAARLLDEARYALDSHAEAFDGAVGDLRSQGIL